MTEQFFKYTDRLVDFTVKDKDLIKSAMTLKEVETKTVLVLSDKHTDELFFILKGCVRKYYMKDGEQITINILTENNFIGAFTSLITGSKSKETIECLEPCQILILKKSDLDRFYQQIPLMNEFIRKILEQTLIQFQQSLASFVLDKPEERYEKLLSESPEILQRVPQHILATYLGITATSLSRIKKRILQRA